MSKAENSVEKWYQDFVAANGREPNDSEIQQNMDRWRPCESSILRRTLPGWRCATCRGADDLTALQLKSLELLVNGNIEKDARSRITNANAAATGTELSGTLEQCIAAVSFTQELGAAGADSAAGGRDFGDAARLQCRHCQRRGGRDGAGHEGRWAHVPCRDALNWHQIAARHEDLLTAKITTMEKELEDKKISVEMAIVAHQQSLEDVKVGQRAVCAASLTSAAVEGAGAARAAPACNRGADHREAEARARHPDIDHATGTQAAGPGPAARQPEPDAGQHAAGRGIQRGRGDAPPAVAADCSGGPGSRHRCLPVHSRACS